MPLSTDIYRGVGEQSLAGGIAGALNQFTEQRARLSDLARQREQQDVMQGFQTRALQRAEEAIPAQQEAAQRQQMEKIGRDIDLGIYTRLQSGIPKDEVAQWAQQAGLSSGLKPEQIQAGIAPIMQIQEPEKLLSYYQRSAMPQEMMKSEMEAQFRKPQAPSALSTLIQEQEAATGMKLTPAQINNLYQQNIQKQITQPLVQVAGQGEVPVYATQAQAVGRQVATKAGKEPQLSAQAQKELFEADETIQASSNVIGLLEQAQALNKKAYSGYGAKQRAIARSNLPGSSEEADATINLDNIMTSQALESLKAVFGGMPTEGERKILMDIQASVDKTPSQREAIMKRAKTAVENRIKFSAEKANKLRSGEYFKPSQSTVQQQIAPAGGVKFLGFE